MGYVPAEQALCGDWRSKLDRRGSPMEHLELGGGLELVPLDVSFQDELYALVEANREHLVRWMPWARTQTYATNREFLEKCEMDREAEKAWVFGMYLDGRLVGTIGSHDFDRANRRALIGYWIAEGAQGRGIVTRAVNGLTDRVFVELEMNRIEIRAAPENRRSRAVAERCGYTFEGVLREVAAFHDGFTDLAMYSRLRREWAALVSPFDGIVRKPSPVSDPR